MAAAALAAYDAQPSCFYESSDGALVPFRAPSLSARFCFPSPCLSVSQGERRVYVGDEVDECAEVSRLTLRRAHESGLVTNWELLRQLWERALRPGAPPGGQGGVDAMPRDAAARAVSTLLVSVPPLDLPACQASLASLAFKTFGFGAVAAVPAALMSHYGAAAAGARRPEGNAAFAHVASTRCCLVVDAGFSASHASPIFGDRVVRTAVRRCAVGGKALTNYMKELISYRAVNVMEEYFIIDDVKEKLCFVSEDVREDLQLAKKGPAGRLSPHRRTYVLPDGVHVTRGYVKDLESDEQRQRVEGALAGLSEGEAAAALAAASLGGGTQQPQQQPSAPGRGGAASKHAYDEQTLVLNNERFAVPEILFRPSDLGAPQAGLVDAVVQAAEACHPDVQELLYGAVIVTGGCANMPGFVERLQAELRPRVPERFELRVCAAASGGGDAAAAAWFGGVAMAATGGGTPVGLVAVTQAEWQHGGAALCEARWAGCYCDL